MSDKIKILFLAADPIHAGYHLRLGEEIREISKRIRGGANRGMFEVVSEWAVRPGDLQEALLRHRPHIVHISGRGSEAEGIVLEDDSGNARLVNQRALARMFQILKGNIRVVVLNACYAKDQAGGISQSVDYTIAMNAVIEDRAAVVFSAYFYQSLAFGCSVEESFELARNELDLEGFQGVGEPMLLVRGECPPSQPAPLSQADTPLLSEGDEHRGLQGAGARNIGGVSRPDEKSHEAVERQPPSPFAAWLFAIIFAIQIVEVLRQFLSREGDWLDTAGNLIWVALVILGSILVACWAISFSHPGYPRPGVLKEMALGGGPGNGSRMADRSAGKSIAS